MQQIKNRAWRLGVALAPFMAFAMAHAATKRWS